MGQKEKRGRGATSSLQYFSLSAAAFLRSCRKVNYATESNVGFCRILVFVSAGTCLQVVSNIFPATATYYFALHQRRIIIFCIPANIGVHIMLEVVTSFVVD